MIDYTKEEIKDAIGVVHACLHIGDERILKARDIAILSMEEQMKVKPRKRGSWNIDENHYRYCPFCGEYSKDGGITITNFCGNCGAKMDGKDESDV